MPVPANTPQLSLGRGFFDARKFRPDTDPAVIDALKMLAMTIGGAGAPGPAKKDDPVYMQVYAQPDGGGAHNLYGGNPADPPNPTPLVVSASGSATVNWKEEGTLVVSSGTVNFVGSAVTVTDVAGTATVTITGGGGSTNSFTTIQVSGQTDVTADTSTDTLTLIAGLGVAITTTDGPETITFAFRNGDGLESDGGSPANIRVKAHTYIDVTSNGVAVDFTEVASYSGASDQYLRNNAGTFEWATLPSWAVVAGTYIDVSGQTVNVDLTEVADYSGSDTQLLGHVAGAIAFDTVGDWLKTLPSYDAAKKMVLTADAGTVEWNEVDDVLNWLAGYVSGNNQSIGHDAAGATEWQDDSTECP